CVDIAGVLPNTSLRDGSFNEQSKDLSALVLQQSAVSVTQPIAEVLELFRQQANLNSVAVLNALNTPVGIVHRSLLSDALLKPFATELLARKAISRLMSDDFLIVEVGQSLQQVSRLLTSRAR